ncbi:hypothetical protein ARALYDRAFT_317521 [Arabidopsis lyrata subsp. lyrata]|uniref:F-box domain-containing protein n=1 Tax=Arabidopsis lyrata subsp. lyrata TaxID=81972 RepID=D7L5J6_ARALL|nr:hypothetical protein ARALYDRAFT_317521 [Arabidopsis lyrata subsp. lyrata]
MSSPPEKKRKTAASTPQSQPTSIQSLPDDLVLSIVARVPRLYHHTLSLVCKSFRSLLVSPELYEARSLSGHIESCLYLCIGCDTDYRMFTLCRKPDQTLTSEEEKKKSNGYVLAPVPAPDSYPAYFSSLVAVGSDIYNIAGSHGSSRVSILDCRSNTWREAPSLGVELTSVSATVIDRKIYVVGRYTDEESIFKKTSLRCWTQKHKLGILSPSIAARHKTSFSPAEPHLLTEKAVAYNSKESRWDPVQTKLACIMLKDSHCQIGNVMYCSVDGRIRWCDTEVSSWRLVKGLLELGNFPCGPFRVKLADYRGNIAVFWVKNFPDDNQRKMILCAEIALERRTSFEIWGKVLWFDHVLTVPTDYELIKALFLNA